MMTEQVRALVSMAGSSAGRQSLDITTCPYDPAGAPVEREQARIWVGAYLASRPPALDSVDYSLSDASPAVRSLLHPGDHHPGDDQQLKHYWLRGEGLAKWSTWTELDAHLAEHVGPDRAARIAATWFHERYGFWPGDHRNNIVGGGQ